jgi:hypothetical protein
MRQGGRREEPEYQRKQNAGNEERENAARHVEIIGHIVAVTASIDRVVAEHAANRQRSDTYERHKRKRGWATFWALVVAAIAAILTLIVSHWDNRAIIQQSEDDTNITVGEARRAANQQHADTLDALRKTDDSIKVLDNQAKVMAGQLSVMENDKRPWIAIDAKIAGTLHTIPKRRTPNSGISLPIELTLSNTGQSPAIYAKILPFLAITGPPGDPLRHTKLFCEDTKTHPIREGAVTYTVFPGRTLHHSATSSKRPKVR